jgi:hypothetical protein
MAKTENFQAANKSAAENFVAENRDKELKTAKQRHPKDLFCSR